MKKFAAAAAIVAAFVLGGCTKAIEPAKIRPAKVPAATNAAGTASTGAPPASSSTQTGSPDFGTRAANAINKAKQEAAEENKRVDAINKQIDQQ